MEFNLISYSDSPFDIKLSFYHIIENLEKQAADPDNEISGSSRSLLNELSSFPELETGITNSEQLVANSELISRLLKDYFSPVLTNNEIKAVNIPYTNIIFNHTQRFKNILNAAGPGFEINIRDFDEHQLYVMSCCIILNEYYGTQLNFGTPLFYDIPTANGINKHYRILYNADFLDLLPTEKSIPLSQTDIDELINNYEDLELWKNKFPSKSWAMKGFAIMTLFDATVENAVSIFKEKLLGLNATGLQESMESIFGSIFGIPDLQIGFSFFNEDTGQFSIDAFGQKIRSFILADNEHNDAIELLSIKIHKKLIKEKASFAVADTNFFIANSPQVHLVKLFRSKKAMSFILAPVVRNKKVLGILEIVSSRPKELNSINANKLEVVMPFLTDTVERLISERQNQVQAVIQETYTTIQPNVHWKFEHEAKELIHSRQLGKEYILNDIVFQDVYPLYGQIDIKGSSDARNLSVQKDLKDQLKSLVTVLQKLKNFDPVIKSFDENIFQLKKFLVTLSRPIKAGTEQYINTYLDDNIYPQLKKISTPALLPIIGTYFLETDKKKGRFHTYRRKYEITIAAINNKMAYIIDNRQKEAQLLFPHYFERFKTDGLEHNMYIGSSISPNHNFDLDKLHKLRLWQLQVLCEMDLAHHYLKPDLPYPLEVTSLVLVYNTTIAIRFRTDEKRFDVDGSYNARFEIVKKRIDKAHIKDTNDRITQEDKLTIVYSNDAEEKEYLQYIKTLQNLNLLDGTIEKFEVEDLKGVSGLMAFRIKIITA